MNRNNADVMKKMQYILNMRPVLNTEALFSDGSDYYRCPSNPKAGDKVRIRFRTCLLYTSIRNGWIMIK